MLHVSKDHLFISTDGEATMLIDGDGRSVAMDNGLVVVNTASLKGSSVVNHVDRSIPQFDFDDEGRAYIDCCDTVVEYEYNRTLTIYVGGKYLCNVPSVIIAKRIVMMLSVERSINETTLR